MSADTGRDQTRSVKDPVRQADVWSAQCAGTIDWGLVRREVAVSDDQAETRNQEAITMATVETGFDQWGRIKKRLRAELGEDSYTSWFGRVDWEGQSGGTVRLSVPTLFLKQWIQTKYKDRLIHLWRDECDGIAGVELSVRGAARPRVSAAGVEAMAAQRPSAEVRHLPSPDERRAAPVAAAAIGQPQLAMREPAVRGNAARALEPVAFEVATPVPVATSGQNALAATSSPLDPRFTFDTFIEGKSNAFALAAARQVADAAPGEPAKFNPLYVHAAVGMGKSHLLQAIAWKVRSSAKRVLYLTAEQFVFRFVAALKSQSALGFKEMLRGIDVLIIDDMQFLTGDKVQQEFCHTLNSLIDGSRQIVVAADRTPADLEGIDERVKSRLAGGLLVEIGAPDADLRRAILKHRFAAAARTVPALAVSESVIAYIAENVASNGRDLDGAINRLVAHAQLSSEAITVDLVAAKVKDLIKNREPRKIKIEDIQRIVTSHYNVSKADLLSARRTRTVVRPRQIAMYLAKVMTPRSLPEIGRRFGGRDHTTVLHAVRKIEEMVGADRGFADEVELLKRLLDQA
ncbi:MAG: chromosomal replication initiator protein DnaA [Hyphomicrobiaceae bacterium]|nr:chromosomal replication initiator protein DnaA [Hyphomicrobiaceae bacterium]